MLSPGVPNVGFVPVNTGKPRNLRPVSEPIFDPPSSQVMPVIKIGQKWIKNSFSCKHVRQHFSGSKKDPNDRVVEREMRFLFAV